MFSVENRLNATLKDRCERLSASLAREPALIQLCDGNVTPDIEEQVDPGTEGIAPG